MTKPVYQSPKSILGTMMTHKYTYYTDIHTYTHTYMYVTHVAEQQSRSVAEVIVVVAKSNFLQISPLKYYRISLWNHAPRQIVKQKTLFSSYMQTLCLCACVCSFVRACACVCTCACACVCTYMHMLGCVQVVHYTLYIVSETCFHWTVCMQLQKVCSVPKLILV